ncbi:hemagglutinin repeat-containing protein [Anaeroarcus burkinensis]|uniref:hemagglutinin repeat-containing protein n=1 Tax=Anaeroarcus burkinensis TaxID=82376 RepID=UPI0004145923|nr:hemagglutinin repeat-containing protein [Anaeroarcus burkinensis]
MKLKKRTWQRVLIWGLIGLLNSQSVFAAATQIEVDPSVAKGRQPQLTQAPNGTPLVNIATPNSSGLSHNKYLNFQVGPNGLILNNSRVIANTQLAGFVPGNPFLGQGSATTILNEVSGSLPSHLNGQIEIAGARANFVLANANGIVGNGFGIVNANRVVLATGTPVFGGNGSLEAFRVTGGTISVEGDGISAKTNDADQVELMARAVKVNAGIWGNTVKVVTGANEIGFSNGDVKPIPSAAAADKPAVALDVSAIGGMYANKIILIGSETGVGVNLQANGTEKGRLLASAGDIDITNTGKIVLSGTVAASKDITVKTADSLVNNGTVYAGGNTALFAAGNVENKENGSIYSRGDILIAGSADKDEHGNVQRANTILNESATMEAEGSIDLYAEHVKNAKKEFTYGQHVVEITYPSFAIAPIAGFDSAIRHYTQTILEGDIRSDSAPAYLLSGKNINLWASSLDNNYSTIAAGKDFNFSLDQFTNIGYQNTNVTIKDGQDTHKKTIPHHKFMHIGCWDEIIYHNITYYDKITVEIPGTVPGVVSAGGTIQGTAGTLNNIVYGPDVMPLKQSTSLTPAPHSTTPLLTMPDGGQYQKPKETAHYVIETNPAFVNKESFLSSDYMLNLIASDPDKVQKRLGDGYYEQKLVRDQITQLTGRRYLGSYNSSEEQYTALMNAGAQYAKQFQLQLGVALTAQQMASLTSDMVWLVEKEVNGQKVLVPIVYLSSVQGKDLKSTGAIVAAQDIAISTGQDLKNQGVIRAQDRLTLAGKNIVNLGGQLSGSVVSLSASEDIKNQSGKINGGDVSLNAGGTINNETLTQSIQHGTLAVTKAEESADITAAKNLQIHAGQDVKIAGATVQAGADATITAGKNIEIDAVQESKRQAVVYHSSASNQDISQHVLSNVKAGNNITMQANGDALLRGAQVEAGNELSLKANGDVKLQAVKDRVLNDASVGQRGGDYFTRYLNDDETVRGSALQATGAVTVAAGTNSPNSGKGNILLEGSSVTSQKGAVTVAAEGDLRINDVNERHEALAESRITNVGLFSSKTTDTYTHSINQQSKGSLVSGETLNASSGRDVQITAGTLVGTGDVSLQAKDNVSILSGKETYEAEHYQKVTTSGIFGSGLGFTIGSRSEKSTLSEQAVTQVGSTIGTANGKIAISSGKNTQVVASDVIGAKGVDITAGENLKIEAAANNQAVKETYEFKQSGLSVSLGGGLVSGLQNTVNTVKSATNAKDGRLQALEAWQAGKQLKDLGDKLNGGWANARNDAMNLNISISIGSQRLTTQSESQTKSVRGSVIDGGTGDVNAKAGTGDLNVIASTVSGNNVKLDAEKGNVNLLAGENTSSEHNSSSSSSASIGVSIGLKDGFKGGVTPIASFSHGTMDANGNVVTHTDTLVSAKENLAINSGNDTNLAGAKASGDKIVANVGGNLNLASLQDSDTYHETSNSVGIDLSLGKKLDKSLGAGVQGPVQQVDSLNATGSLNRSKMDSDYNSVAQQTGIYAGKDGFDIQVGKNTDLKGAVIASDATPDKNKLSTGTLTYSDIQNKADYNAESSGYSVGTQKGSSGYSPGIPVSGNAGSTTKSAIAPGTIVVGGKAVTPESLRRDTTTALNELGKIFDKKTVQEKQELVNLFSKEANQAIGDFAESMRDNAKTLEEKAKWAQGGEYKAILHAFVSGFTSSLSGNDFLSGSIGDGISQLAQKQLANIKDPTLRLFASAAIGAGAAKAVGGNAKIGAITSYNGVKYNDLADHWITLDGVRVLFSGYVVIEAGKQVLKDQAGNIIGTWVAETEEWVSNTFNSPGTDISTPNGSTVFDNPANNPSMGGTTTEGEEQGGNSTVIPAGDPNSGASTTIPLVPQENDQVINTSSNWGRLDTLQDHYERHGSDFGATSPSEYAEMANDFYNNQSQYQVKVDENGTTRVYDPSTNTFGSYNADGTTKTFYKPKRGIDYWNDQPGE